MYNIIYYGTIFAKGVWYFEWVEVSSDLGLYLIQKHEIYNW